MEVLLETVFSTWYMLRLRKESIWMRELVWQLDVSSTWELAVEGSTG
jgi:hypothetical protein